MYIMRGVVRNPDPNTKKKYNIVTGNYMDGIPAEEYSTVAGGATYGAYSRSKKTEVGGWLEKLFIASYQHLQLDPYGSDCGTKRHIVVNLTKDNIDNYMYSYVIQNNGSLELIDTTTRDKYIGKTVKLRFSSMCESKTGICNKCAGELIYRLEGINNNSIKKQPINAGIILAQVPDTMKLRSMKGFHNAQIKTNKVDAMKVFFPYGE